MDPWKHIEQRLGARDALEKEHSEHYRAFTQLAKLLSSNWDKQRESVVLENETLVERLNKQTLRLEGAEKKNEEQARQIRTLQHAKTRLEQKITALGEELAEKNRAIGIVNDEHLVQQIQHNVLKDEIALLRAENAQLVLRWMARVAQDADSMNLQNEQIEER